jgi:hypothetical protein
MGADQALSDFLDSWLTLWSGQSVAAILRYAP